MSIQAGINQLLSVAGILSGMNPQLRAKAEMRSDIKNLTKQKEDYSKIRDIAGRTSPELAMEYQSRLADLSKKLFETNPNEQNLQNFLTEYSGTEEAMRARTTPEDAARKLYEKEQYNKKVEDYLKKYRSAEQSAQQSLQMKQNEKRSTRRNFLDYIKDEPISFGKGYVGKVGELSKNLQKTIAKDFSKSERKQIMNRKDEQNG